MSKTIAGLTTCIISIPDKLEFDFYVSDEAANIELERSRKVSDAATHQVDQPASVSHNDLTTSNIYPVLFTHYQA